MKSQDNPSQNPKLPKGYKQTEVGVIPNDWVVRKLGESIDYLVSGYHIVASKVNSDQIGIPYMTGPSDFASGKIVISKYSTQSGAMCKQNDILITVKGSGAGKIIISNGSYCISRQLMAIGSERNSNKYLYYVLFRTVDSLRSKASGLIPGISRSDLKHIPIPLPPTLAEQEKIAEVLSDTDAYIEKLESILQKKKWIKQGAMQELLTGKKRLVGKSNKAELRKQSSKNTDVPLGYKMTEVGVIPEDWVVRKLGDVGKFRKGKGIKKDEVSNEGKPCIRYGEIYTIYNNIVKFPKSFISEETAISSEKIEYGDILFAGSGETSTEIGKSVAYINKYSAYAGGDIVILNLTQDYLPEFFGYLLNDYYVKKQKSMFSQGDTVAHIYSASLKKIIIPLPPTIAEQEKIAEVLSDMDAEIEKIESKIEKYKYIKKGMMQKLLTGQLRLV
jgi:type I restriction enzyme, S subunit